MNDKSAAPLEITVTEGEAAGGIRASVVRAEGEIDLANAGELERALKPIASEVPLVLDLSAVPFIDSSGLRVILMAAQERGDRLAVLIAPGSGVERIVEVAQVDDAIRRHDDEAAALNAVTGSAPEGS